MIDSTQHYANVDSIYELHAAGIYTLPHGSRNWVVPEAGFGVSMIHIRNRVQSLITGTEQVDGMTIPFQEYSLTSQQRYSWSPLVRLGCASVPGLGWRVPSQDPGHWIRDSRLFRYCCTPPSWVMPILSTPSARHWTWGSLG